MTTEPTDGGPAFPTLHIPGQSPPGWSGISIRDWLASRETLAEFDRQDGEMTPELMKILTGEEMPEGGWSGDKLAMWRYEAKARAVLKYIRADAMLAARKGGAL